MSLSISSIAPTCEGGIWEGGGSGEVAIWGLALSGVACKSGIWEGGASGVTSRLCRYSRWNKR